MSSPLPARPGVTTLQPVGPHPDRVLAAERPHLPAPPTRLFGREEDSGAVRDLVLHSPGRLVTLTGTGGCGKTQLALQVAAGLVDTFAGGGWLGDLGAGPAPPPVP